ncbi:DUF6817 domain-containing protein [Spongorhabdus nitratireducens]
MNHKFEKLASLGAGDFQHLHGSLETHLKGTESLLAEWGADETLRTAGLFHAAYGTAGFDEQMVSLARRGEIAAVIGKDAEALVYLYCACDRDAVYPRFGKSSSVRFRNRFNDTEFEMSVDQMTRFCELTAANELELVCASDQFKQQYGQGLFDLFETMNDYLSPQARAAYQKALAEFA